MAATFSTVVLPSFASAPGVDTLQLTEDGQVIAVTRTAIHFLTPTLGLSLDASGVSKGTGKDSSDEERAVGLDWHRTQLQVPAASLRWFEESDEYPATIMTSLENVWHSCCASPSGLSDADGCMFVTLTSNLQLALWESQKHFAEGQLVKKQDLTLLLKANYADMDDSCQATLQMQTASMSWSQQPLATTRESLEASRAASILVVGSRGGTVAFLRYNSGLSLLTHVHSLQLAKDWITQLAWSPWRVDGPWRRSAFLAYASPDGRVNFVSVLQTLDHQTNEWDIETAAIDDALTNQTSTADSAQVTALSWIASSDNLLVLAYCKPGRVFLYADERASAPSSTPRHWTGLRSLALPTINISAGSSRIAPASGLIYIPARDALLVSLSDGSIHVICNISSSPAVQTTNGIDNFDSTSLSSKFREYFARQQAQQNLGKAITVQEANRMTGSVAFGADGQIILLTEAARPNFYFYVPDSQKRSIMLLAPLWQVIPARRLAEAIDQIKTAFASPDQSNSQPVYRYQAVLMHLRDSDVREALTVQIIALDASIALPQESLYQPDPTIEDSEGLHRLLQRRLDSDALLATLRTRYFVLNACYRSAESDEVQQLLRARIQDIDAAITRARIGIFIDSLHENLVDREHGGFLSRILGQATRLGCSPRVLEIASSIAQVISAAVPTDECPACRQPIVSYELGGTRCARGHAWGTCSITSCILSTPHVRTCSVCDRKALLSPSQMRSPETTETAYALLPQEMRTWLAGALLEANRRCPYCGGLFVILV